jgi:1,4-alpha-glucan branching enzyme
VLVKRFAGGNGEGLTGKTFEKPVTVLTGTTVVEIKETGEVQKLVTIHYYDPEANSVSVIGTFNGWSPESSRLREVSDGVWEITLHLLPGKYAYRLLINNRQQILDPRCSIQEPDGYGGKNSVLYIE